MRADDLLDRVRHAVGRDDVGFAEQPERLGGGFFTENHAFRLVGAPPAWDGPLVVRLFPSSAPPDFAHREAAVQRVLVDQGYPAPPVVILTDGDRLTGVLDYTVSTVAEPALDVGFTAMSFNLAPIDAPPPIQRIAARVARATGVRYIESYHRETGADLTNQPYYARQLEVAPHAGRIADCRRVNRRPAAARAG